MQRQNTKTSWNGRSDLFVVIVIITVVIIICLSVYQLGVSDVEL